ncbi:MAG: Rieske (2Fe-2S) protein, partial [Longimicrobiales bacterium]|nr:Rieske (2Fe-2S) protein [Longimicrobiales bacterium]
MISKNRTRVATWTELEDRAPAYALVAGVDLVVVRYDDQVSVMYGRCHHRGALLADGHIDGENLICGVHGWDYRYDTGVSEYNNDEALHSFAAVVDEEADAVWVDVAEAVAFALEPPQPYDR